MTPQLPPDQKTTIDGLSFLSELMSDIATLTVGLTDVQSRVAQGMKRFAEPTSVISSDPQSPSNRDASTDGEASSGAAPESEAPQAGTGGETFQGHEGHIAEGAGEDASSAMDRRSDPAPAAEPTQPPRTDRARVLDYYENSTGRPVDIARALDIKASSVRVYLADARGENDLRIAKGDALRQAAANPALSACLHEDHREAVLIRYSMTATQTAAQIGDQLGLKSATVRDYLRAAREAKDPRVLKGDQARRATDQPVAAAPDTASTKPRSGLVLSASPGKRTLPEEPRAQLRLPSAPPPALKRDVGASPKAATVLPARAGRAPQPASPVKRIIPHGDDLRVDLRNLRLHGPLGDMEVARNLALTLHKMRDGNAYDIKTLAETGGWIDIKSMLDHVGLNRTGLEKIGINFVAINKIMCRVRRVGE